MAQKFTSPFFNNDLKSSLTDFSTPTLDAEAVIHTQRKNVEAANIVGQKMLEVTQSLMRRQVQASQEIVEDAGKLMRDLMGDGTPEEKAVRQTELLRKSFEKAVKNFKDISDTAQKARSEVGDIVTDRVTAGLVELKYSLQTGTGHKKSSSSSASSTGKTVAANDSSAQKVKSSEKVVSIKSADVSKASANLVKKDAVVKSSAPKAKAKTKPAAAKAAALKTPVVSKPLISIVSK